MTNNDSFEGRILWHLGKLGAGKMINWKDLKQILESEIGSEVNSNTLQFKLKKLRNEEKVKFIQIGETTFYQISYPSL